MKREVILPNGSKWIDFFWSAAVQKAARPAPDERRELSSDKSAEWT